MREKLDSAAKVYEDLPIPNGYGKIIEDTIKEAENRRKSRYKLVWVKKSGIVAAIGLGLFVSTLNVNAQFADTVAQIPIIGGVAQLLTFSHQEEVTDTYELKADIPKISSMTDEAYQEKMNQAINQKMEALIEEGKERANAYKKAYIETGGNEETFRPVIIDIDYSIKYSGEGVLSFVIDYAESFASAYSEQYFYNIDLMNNKELALEDLFEEGYEVAINESIHKQMKERTEKEGATYFTGEEAFQGITKDTNYYINQYGEVVIVFGKYEIASGAMGIQEFVIRDVPMKVHYPAQVSYTVEERQLEGNAYVKYPVIVGYKGELLMDYMNQSLYSVIEKYSRAGYSNLVLDYNMTRMDDTVLSITFRGGVELEGIGRVPIRESISLDTAKTGQELTIANYIKQDDVSQEKWREMMDKKAREKGLQGFEAEGIRMCFKDSRVVFYYMPLHDMAKEFVYITLSLEELEPVVNQAFEHIYHS